MPVRDDNIGKSIQIESSKPSSKRNVQKDKRNKKKKKTVSRKYTITGNIVSLQAGQDNPVNKITSDLVGATLSVTNPHTLVDTNRYPSTRYTLPTTYSTTISKVINETTFEVSEPYYVTDDTLQKIPVSLEQGSISITYDTYKTETENSVFQRSFAELTIGNLRTFSGDVYKAKVYTRDSHTSTDFEEIYDTFVVPENILVDSTSINGYENIGFFHTGSIIANNWVSSSTNTETEPFVSLNNEKLIDGVQISGSTQNLEDKVTFRTNNSFDLEQSVDYVVRFNSYYFKSISKRRDDNDDVSDVNHASLKIYLSGSAITGQNGEDDFFLGEVDVPDSLGDEGSIPDVVGRFRTAGSGSPKAWLKFELNSGRFIVQDVSIEPFSETNFNPSFFKVLAPMPKAVRRGDKYDFLVEFYDSNNNIAETTAQVNGVTFQGPRQVISDGLDGVLSGSLLIGESLEMYGVNPAYLRSVGYNGFDNTISNNKGGFMLFSGSVGTRITASESYEGVGLEIVDAHSDIDRYLKFRTNPSQFEVVTDTFFFGRDGQFISGSGGTIAISSSNFFLGDSNGAFISGSQGNLQISSSNFSVDVDGNVTMSGFVSASGGHIGNFQIVEGKISGSNITMDANTSTIFKTDQGPGSDTSAVFDQLRDEYYIDFTPTEEAPDNFFIKFGPNFMVDKDGILIASGATFEGSITASAGLIGGFTIGSASLFNGSEGTPNFFFSGSANGSNFDKGNLFISSSGFQVNSQGAISASSGQIGGFNINTDGLNSDSNEFQITGSTGQVTGSQVLFTGGKIGGWTLSNTTLANGTDIVLDSSNKIISLNDSTFANQGIQLDYNSGSPRFYAGDGSNKFIKFDGTNVEIESEKFELDANNLEISSTQASMSLGEGKIKLKGGSTSFMTIGTGGNAISASVDSSNKFISIGKSDFSEFDQTTKGFIVGDNGGIFRFEIALDAQNYMSFDGTANTLDIKTEKFLLDTDNLDIDSDNKKITITDAQGTPRERVRIGKVDTGADNYGLKIFDGTGAAADGTILAEFSNDQNVIAGWNISTSTISSNNLILNSAGQISSQGYASNQQGFFLGMRPLSDGSVGAFLEVDEANIRGTLKTTVFEKETVNAVGGQLQVGNSTTITGSKAVGASDTVIQVANASGFASGEIILAKKFNSTGFTTEYMEVQSVAREDGGSDTNFSGSLTVLRGRGQSPPSTTVSGSLGGTGQTGQTYTPGQVLVSTGKIGTGYIRINANPNDQTTPYMDIVERTGSGVYDVELKARLGDLSGVVDTINGQAVSGFGLYTDNAFLKGGIVATYGSIGGLNMSSTDLWAGNSSLGAGGTVMVIGDITTAPKIALGGTADSMDLNTGDGIFMSSSGEFRVGDIDGDRLIFEGGNLSVTASNFGLDAGTLHISSSNNGAIALGTGGPGSQAPTQLDDNGILLLGSGYFNLQNSATNYIRNNASGFDIASTNFTLKGGTTLFMDSATNSGKITLGTNASSISHTGTGIYLDGTGKFSFVEDGNNYIQGGNSNFEIAAQNFTLSAGSAGSGELGINTTRIALGSTLPTAYNNGTGFFVNNDGEFLIGAHNGDRIQFGGSGNITIVSSDMDITATTFELDATELYISSANQRIALGADGSTLGYQGTGIFLGEDGSGIYKFSLKSATGDSLSWNGAGQLDITGNITADDGTIGGWTINSTNIEKDGVRLNAGSNNGYLGIGITSYNTNNGIWIGETSSGLYQMSLKNSGGTKYFKWDGTNLEVDAGNFSLDSSGNITATSVDLTGTITATDGFIGGWDIVSNTLESVNSKVILDSTGDGKIRLGSTTPPTSATNGEGIFLGGDGTFLVGDADGHRISFESSNLTVSSSVFDLNTTNLQVENTTPKIRVGASSGGSRIELDGSTSEMVFYSGSAEQQVIKLDEKGSITIFDPSTTSNTTIQKPEIRLLNGGSVYSVGTHATNISLPQIMGFNDDFAFFQGGKNGSVVNIRNDFSSGTFYGLYSQATDGGTIGAASATSIIGTKTEATTKEDGTATTALFATAENTDSSNSTGQIRAVRGLAVQNASGTEDDFFGGHFSLETENPGTLFTTRGSAVYGVGGKYAIHGKSAGTYQGYFEGDVAATGNIIGYVSDKRVKENLIKIESPINKVKQLTGYTFDWSEKSSYTRRGTRDVGLIAQDVQKVLPEAITNFEHSTDDIEKGATEEKLLSVQYQKLVPLLVESIKELTKRIEELEKQNTKIEVD